MDRLWAPWRIKYISGKKRKGCIFCKASQEKSHVIFKTKRSVVMLNTFPYNNGHLMIAPLKHTAELSRLTEPEMLDLLRSLQRAKSLLDKILKPHGYNIGINLSESAGAGIADHLHIHIVPRWKGDTNFMPVFYGTKIISQSLDELAKRLRRADISC
jgi:ATP adenylyltransferase